MTKMAAMPIYGKNPSKIIFSETNRLISRKLGVRHRWLKYSNVYINHDPVMTVTKFMARSTWVACASELGKLLKCHLKEKSQQEIGKWTEYWRFWKKKMAQGLICPCTGVKYHDIQTCLLVYAADLRWAFTGPLVLWFRTPIHFGRLYRVEGDVRDSRIEPAKASLLSCLFIHSVHSPDNLFFIKSDLFIYLFIYLFI